MKTVNTVQRVEKKVGKALGAFRTAQQALVEAEAELDSELGVVELQLESLTTYKDSVEQQKATTASIRQKMDDLLS